MWHLFFCLFLVGIPLTFGGICLTCTVVTISMDSYSFEEEFWICSLRLHECLSELIAQLTLENLNIIMTLNIL